MSMLAHVILSESEGSLSSRKRGILPRPRRGQNDSKNAHDRFRISVEVVLGLLTLALGTWLFIQNVVPGGTFIAERSIEELSPWIKNFWPPTYVHLLQKGDDGRWYQRIAVSPVSIRVRTPRGFRSVEVALDAEGIPSGSMVGVEQRLHSGIFVRVPFDPSGTVLTLTNVDQSSRDLQFQFEFPGLTQRQPVIVRSLRFTFYAKER